MIARIKNKIRFSLLKLKIHRFSEARRIKVFENLDLEMEQHKKKLRPYYEHYIRDISRADMAASLELAAFIFSLCKINQFKKVLDMGSGLSSFIFRLYAKENPGVNVFSIDDDAAWLEKTKGFLEHYRLDTKNMYTLNEFLKKEDKAFDCILHDLNFVEVRINYVEKLMELSKQNGLVIFDDVHKPDYLFALLIKLKNFKSSIYNMKPVTVDSYGRFSLAVVKE
jgi:predicted O-methyltransferase YrrM